MTVWCNLVAHSPHEAKERSESFICHNHRMETEVENEKNRI